MFHQVSEVLDDAVIQRYHKTLSELKTLFHGRQKADDEYWFIQKIDDLLRRSNFVALPSDVLKEKFLVEQSSSSVNVRIKGENFQVLKIWILGREQIPDKEIPFHKRLFRSKEKQKSSEYFKRFILAVRPRGQDRLYFKAFRDVAVKNLPQLLPIGEFQLGKGERSFIRYSLFSTSLTAVTYLISVMAEMNLSLFVGFGSTLSALLAFWAYRTSYKSKIDYLIDMNQSLFYKSVASDKQLLAMIVDRAEDELSKEMFVH